MSEFTAAWVVEDGVHHLHIHAAGPLKEDCFQHHYDITCWFDDKELGRWKSKLGTDNSAAIHVFRGSDDPEKVFSARYYTVMRFLKEAQAHLHAAHEAVDLMFQEGK